MNADNNPLLCDPKKGICETPNADKKTSDTSVLSNSQNNIRIVYFTDPICSSCWGIEPQLRKLKLEYGSSFEIEYRMGGLLPDWSYNSGGISKPSDVASHWDEASYHYDMPIDGDVWLEDPLDSSYPPSIAFKAAQLQDENQALLFLRELREMVFLKKKNITKWEHIAEAAEKAGLDINLLKEAYTKEGKSTFQDDLNLAQKSGVRGFPTLFFVDQNGKQEVVYGSRPYAYYEMAMLKLNPEVEKQDYPKDWKFLFSIYSSLTAKEFSVLSGMPRKDCEAFLDNLVKDQKLDKFSSKNGSLWTKK